MPSRISGRIANGVDTGHATAHRRVRDLRGPASDHQCEHCDRQAQDWAYDHLDPNPSRDSAYGEFSRDPAYYLPLCRRCHNAFDRAHRALMKDREESKS